VASQSPKNTQRSPVALDCPSCGAALPNGEGKVTCAYCGSIVQISRPKPTERAPNPGEPSGGVVWSTPTVTIIQAKRRPVKQQANPAGCVFLGIFGAFMIATLLFVLTVSGAFTAILPASMINNTPLQPRLIAFDHATSLTPEQARPQIIAFVSLPSASDNNERLALIDLATGKRIWVGPGLSEDAYASAPVAFSADTILFPDNRTLKAFSRADGTQLWASEITDRVCDECLVVVGDTAVALASDYAVQGYDLASGERLWVSDVLGSYGLNKLRIVDGKILIYGRNADVDGQISLLDPTTGEVVQQFTPECKPDLIDEDRVYTNPDDAQWLSADGKTMVMFADTFKPCFMAYDPISGKRLWQQPFEYPDGGISLTKTIIAGSNDFFQGGSSRIMAVARDGSAVRELFAEPDYIFEVLSERDGVLLTLAVKQRGSRIGELWAIDAASGKRLWRKAFAGDGEMLREPFKASGTIGVDEEIWDILPTDTGVFLIRVATKPHRYILEQLDLKTGEARSSQTLNRPDDDTIWVPDIVLHNGNLLVMNEQSILVALDLPSGTVVYEGP
jgi:outer membrane protein assembly factor BamB